MEQSNKKKAKLARFGRALALLFNRGMMYQMSHPMIQDSVTEAHKSAEEILSQSAPVVFILNREQFFLDEEPLDPRINVKRIANLFESHSIQSISFDQGLTAGELRVFVEIFSSLTLRQDVETIKKSLQTKGAYHIKINHVLYKKVTEDDQIISRDMLKSVTPDMDESDPQSRKRFMDTLLESVLTDEFAKSLTIQNLLANPAAVSKKMIEADLASSEHTMLPDHLQRTGGDIADLSQGVTQAPGQGNGLAGGAATGPGGAGAVGVGNEAAGAANAGGTATGASPGVPLTSGESGSPVPAQSAGHGPMLLHQLDLMRQEVEKQLEDGDATSNLENLADAVFDLKKRLFEGIETQKALGVAYANESTIVNNVNELTDRVIIRLIQEEYKDGNIPIARLALIITRLVPQASELKRLLPKIKQALLDQGMMLSEYLDLIQELKNELKSEELARILQESSDAIGIDSENIMAEVKQNPDQAAKLIYLASEIRKGTGDDAALADILVDYVEKMGQQIARDATATDAEQGEEHLQNVIGDVESTIIHQLGRLDLDNEVLLRIEERINNRMESILDSMRIEWLRTKATSKKAAQYKPLTVLQTLEQSVSGNEELVEILNVIREKVESGDIDENDFSSILAEIILQMKQAKEATDGLPIPDGVLNPDELMFIIDKEIARANRYDAPFSALALSLVAAKPKMKALSKLINTEAVTHAALEKMTIILRDGDYIGQIGKNKIIAILPMIKESKARQALDRVMNQLHSQPLDVQGVPVYLRIAGVASAFDPEKTPDTGTFAKQLSNQLTDMVARVKNIQVLF
jgi:GGDEF domain-containing protein